MKLILLFLIGVFVAFVAEAQEPEATTVSRSVRQKINTKPIYEAVLKSTSKSTLSTISSVDRVSNQLQAIQFVQSKAEFMPGAQPALEQLVTYMRENPTVEIELAGHTDNQGDFDQNVSLSKKRVDLVKEYLVKNGITAKRVTTRGYGPTRPIASNNAEATRQLNRRVEMVVLKP